MVFEFGLVDDDSHYCKNNNQEDELPSFGLTDLDLGADCKIENVFEFQSDLELEQFMGLDHVLSPSNNPLSNDSLQTGNEWQDLMNSEVLEIIKDPVEHEQKLVNLIPDLLEPTKTNLSTAATSSAIPQQKTSVGKKIDMVAKCYITKHNERFSPSSEWSESDNESSEDDKNTDDNTKFPSLENEIIDVVGIPTDNDSIILEAPDTLSLFNEFEKNTNMITNSRVFQGSTDNEHADIMTSSCARVIAPQSERHNNDITFTGIVSLQVSSNMPVAYVQKQQLSHCNNGNNKSSASVSPELLQKLQRKKRKAVEIIDPIPKKKWAAQKQQLLKANASSSEAIKRKKRPLKINTSLPEITENNRQRHIINLDHSYCTTQRKIEELQTMHQPVPSRTLSHSKQQSNIQPAHCKTQRKVELQRPDRPVSVKSSTPHLKQGSNSQSTTHYTTQRKVAEQQRISQPVLSTRLASHLNQGSNSKFAHCTTQTKVDKQQRIVPSTRLASHLKQESNLQPTHYTIHRKVDKQQAHLKHRSTSQFVHCTTQPKVDKPQKIDQPVLSTCLASHLKQASNSQPTHHIIHKKVEEQQGISQPVPSTSAATVVNNRSILKTSILKRQMNKSLNLDHPSATTIPSKNADSATSTSSNETVLQTNPANRDLPRRQSKKLNLDEYKRRRDLPQSSGSSKTASPIGSGACSPAVSKDSAESYQENITKMAIELLQTTPKHASNRNLEVEKPDSLKTICNGDVNSPFLPSHLEKKELVSRGVNTDTAQLDVIISNKLSEIQPILESARSRISNNSLITSVIQNLKNRKMKGLEKNNSSHCSISNSNNSSTHMSPEEHGEDKIIMWPEKNRPKKPTRDVYVQTETVTCDMEASTDKKGERRRQESHSSSSSCHSSSIESPYSPTSYSSSSYDKSRSSSPSSEYRHRKRLRDAEEEEARRQHLIEVNERRIIYIGGISSSTTTELLRRKFEKFGPITKVSVHFPGHGDNYGFVTYANKCDAYRAVDEASRDPRLLHLKIHFGGRRDFCENYYQDLDDVHDSITTYHSVVNKVPFEYLLKQTQAVMRKRNGM